MKIQKQLQLIILKWNSVDFTKYKQTNFGNERNKTIRHVISEHIQQTKQSTGLNLTL